MAQIDVEKVEDDRFKVTVREGKSRTVHRVTLHEAERAQFGGASGSEALLEESFRFLLEREPKESILQSFELSVIERYFPEYRDEIRKRLA
ncbi:MAG: hypothetical protein OEM05_11865 [Myxococcales bacterium]|nr:hypothetical protein [Myxococcales bacterium]